MRISACWYLLASKSENTSLVSPARNLKENIDLQEQA
jgi:hypothetical protein